MKRKQENYFVHPINEPEFEEIELIRMGVMFIEKLDELENAVNKLGFPEFKREEDLNYYGLCLTKMGLIEKDGWAVYYIGLSFQYVLDIFNKHGFYFVTKEVLDKDGKELERVVVFNKIYLRKGFFKEDLEYYVSVMEHSKNPEAPIAISDYLN